jgi:stearoyl-CoA desaturase (delta-9 desaturase)
MTRILPAEGHRVDWRASVPFIACHLVPLLGFFTGVTAEALVLGVVLYLGRMFAITAGYHRYFAHRAFRLGRVPQLVLAFAGTTAAQKGPLWWASNHRDHHRYADTARDPHSPQHGFWWSHVGWVVSPLHKDVDRAQIADFARYPELRFLDRHDWIGPWVLGVASFAIAGWSGLVVGFFGSTVLLWHATFLVNSYAHVFGRRRYGTTDTSRNSVLVALLTMGEGWHNNHHHYPASARQGFRWWEIDVTYYLLRALAVVGIVRGLRRPPVRARQSRRLRQGHLDLGALRLHLNRASATLERVREALPVDERDRLRRTLADVAERAGAAVGERVRTASPG